LPSQSARSDQHGGPAVESPAGLGVAADSRATGGTTPAAHSVFAQPWWLDAVAPGCWDASVVTRGDEVVARLPFVVKSRFGVTVLTQPPLTPFLGPWIRETASKPANQLEAEKELTFALIDQLPPFVAFRQSFAPAVTNWLPFYWRGFAATTRYTYRVDGLHDLDEVWRNFAHNTRKQIRKAQKELSVRADLGVDVLLALNRQIFDRQGLPAPIDGDLLGRLDAACESHGRRTLLFAVDAQDRVHAAAFIVHDGSVSYLLISGADSSLRSSGAQSYLTWEAIQRSALISTSFDFAGSMIESIERFNRGFSARQLPYLHVRRTRSGVKPFFAAQDEFRRLAMAARRKVRGRTGPAPGGSVAG
jgi:Acetyltransferase (GNAT) domain